MTLDHNDLAAGPIPAWLSGLTNLEQLVLSETNRTGLLPDWLGSLTNLRWLALGGNDLTAGPIPALSELSNLEALFLGSTNRTGSIPSWLRNLTNLRRLHLGDNRLTGPIPAALGGLVELRTLELQNNALTGEIPSALTNLSKLDRFDASGTAVCVPSAAAFRAWREAIAARGRFRASWCDDHAGDRATLEAFYDATGGSEWRTSTNWKTEAPLRDWYGVTTDADGRVSELHLHRNGLTGFIPPELRRLHNLQLLLLPDNGLTGQTPTELTSLGNLSGFDVSGNAVCVPALAEFEAWRAQIEARGGTFLASSCDEHGGDREDGSRIDLLVVYTPAAEETAGGSAAIRAVIDLAVAETNQAFRDSGVITRVNLVGVEEVNYRYSEQDPSPTEFLLRDPSDGYLDEIHAMRDERAADLVALFVTDPFPYGGTAFVLRAPHLANAAEEYAFSVNHIKYPSVLAHELGHNMGLDHDRWDEVNRCCTARDGRTLGEGLYPYGYGYVNQHAFEPDASVQSRWHTIMAIGSQCADAGLRCGRVFRYSNPDLIYNGDPTGVPGDERTTSLTGPADARRTLNGARHIVANYRRPHLTGSANRPPEPLGALPPLALEVDGAAVAVEVGGAFRDPDGDRLLYGAASSVPSVAAVAVLGSTVTLTPTGKGTATVTVTATDAGGSNGTATQTFIATVGLAGARGFTDDPIVPGVTPVRAVHFTELRVRIDVLRRDAGLAPFTWTDRLLLPGVTPVMLVHLTELRSALAEAFAAAGRAVPQWTDPSSATGLTPIRAAHLTELRAAVLALE